jgi:mono/diheme cytochrome c family protein
MRGFHPGAVGVLWCALCLPNYSFGQAASQPLPEGKGKAEFVHNCTACHRAEMVTRVKKTPQDWRKSVDDMAARGTDGTPQDMDNIVAYLSKNYGLPTGSSAAAAPAATAAAGGLSASDIDRVKTIVADNGCLTCHLVDDLGAHAGPSLNGIGAHRSADEIRKAIVSPGTNLSSTAARMPSYEGRIAGDDLDLLVRYLHALPADESQHP